jgi:type I restriction enzyme M protein
LEGLEITVRPLSQVYSEHLFMRLDSEHCQKQFLANLSLIRTFKSGWSPLGDELEELTGGATPLGADYPESGVRFLRVQNIMPNYIDDSDMTFIADEDDELLSRSRLQTNDVLLTITGVSYVKAAVVMSEFAGCNINQHSVRMKLKRTSFLRPVFLATFLNADAGKLQSDQNITGVTRPALDYPTVRNFSVPRVSDAFQEAVETIVLAAHRQFEDSKRYQAAAEQTLLQALGLKDWQPPEPLTYTRSASEALAAQRIDSDFFAPARYATLKKLAAMPHRLLSDYCTSVRELLDPTKEQGIAIVRNFDVTDALKPSLDDSKEIVDVGELGSTKKIMEPGDVVISRLRSYLRQIAVVRTSKSVPTAGSTEFIVLRPHKKISPELLMVFLRSQPVQTILKYCQEGNQHPRFGESNLLEIPFPEVLLEHSEEIISHIRQAHAARQQAQVLLAKAKRAVEVAIEEGEEKAMILPSRS